MQEISSKQNDLEKRYFNLVKDNKTLSHKFERIWNELPTIISKQCKNTETVCLEYTTN